MYTYRITNDENGIIAWIDNDEQPIIMQPHHHNAVNNEPWSSEEDATAWAEEAIVNLQQQAELEQARASQVAEDRQRLINIENMLKQLTGQE